MIAIERAEEGRVRIVDLEGRSGLSVDGRAVGSILLEGPVVIRIGRTETEVEAVAECPPLEVPVASRPRGERWRGAAACLVYVAIGIAGIVAGQLGEASFWSPWNHTRWVGLVQDAITTGLALPTAAGALFLVLKVIGRRVRIGDTLRALALLTWFVPVLHIVFFAAYYPLTPSQYGLFHAAVAAVAIAIGVASLVSIRREPRSLAFTFGWAAAVLVAIVGLGGIAALSSVQTGEPSVDLNLQAPLAGYAGRAESFDEYLSAVRAAAGSGETEREAPAQGKEDLKAAALR